MSTINSDGKIAYIYNQSNDTWYAIGGAVNTNAPYTWTADQTFNSTVNFSTVIKAKAGVNNFQNPSSRDLNITSPTNGIVCFIRQTDSGDIINQIQYYYNGQWRWIQDSADLSRKTSDYTLIKEDAGKTINVDSSSPITITVPANSLATFVVGQKVEVVRTGTGQVTISPANGVIINSKNSNKKISSQYSGCVILKTDTNTWLLIGDLTA
jgi:hypothetical protein